MCMCIVEFLIQVPKQNNVHVLLLFLDGPAIRNANLAPIRANLFAEKNPIFI